MANISEFISRFKGGGARADKFRAIISYPAIVGTPDVPDSIIVHIAALPSSTVSPTLVYYMGRALPMLGDRQLEPLNISLYNDTSFSHRNAFERWMNAINSHEGNIQASSNYKDLLGRVQIDQLDRDDSVLKSVVFHNVFPDSLSQLDLDWSAQDQVETFSVALAYSHWTSNTTT